MNRLQSNDIKKQSVGEPTSVTDVHQPNENVEISQRKDIAEKTKWSSIWLASVILLLVALQYSIYFPSLWPYLTKIDSTSTQTFYGLTLAAFSGGQMISSPLFGYWNNKIQRVRVIIAVGVCFSIGGNLLYIFTEAAEDDRKWIIFCGRFLCGIGAGIAGSIRGYVATASTPADQKLAVSIGSVAWSMGIAGGPLIQFILTPIGYPAYIAGPLHFSEYTAPAYVSILAGIILLLILITVFKEHYIGLDDRKETDQFHYVPKPDMIAAILLLACYFATLFAITNIDTVQSPYTMAVFNWSDDDAVYYNSIIISASFGLSTVLYILLTVYTNRINERVSLLIGLLLLLAFYSCTFSWSFYTGQLDFKSSTNVTRPVHESNVDDTLSTLQTTATTIGHQQTEGCDADMEWCHYTPRLPLAVFLASYAFLSIGYPFCFMTSSTIFAKVLGPRKQGFMQSVMIMTGSLARTIGPILISWLFAAYGPRIAWLLTSFVIGVSACCTVIGYNRLVPLQMRPKLRSGQKLYYDEGTLYHF